MSSLEVKMKSIYERLAPLVVAESALLAEEAEILAAWAVKTAMTLNVSSNYRDLFSPEEIGYLGTHKLPSPNCYVDMLWTGGEPQLAWRQSQWMLGLIAPEPRFQEALRRSFRITLRAGHLQFRVLVADASLLQPTLGKIPTIRLWPKAKRQPHICRMPSVDIDDLDGPASVV